MGSTNHQDLHRQVPTPPAEDTLYSRPSAAQAAADVIPILVDDTYHVFHLTTPPFTRHHPPRLRSTWSRLKTKDLVNWTRDQEMVLRPGANSSDPDADGAWTGCAVQGPDGCMNIFYTGYNLSQNGKQVILRVVSSDANGTVFEGEAKVITIHGDGSQYEEIDFRDPYIFFNEAEGKYWMLVSRRLAAGSYWYRGCIALLTSTNLDTWELDPGPLYAPSDMLCPECPEMFSLPNGKWYLVYSRFHAPNAGTVYRIADSPRGPFRIPRDGSHGRLDGRRWYAAKSCPKAGDPERRVYFGWVGDYVDEEGKWLWGGDLGVPREISAGEQGYLKLEVASTYLNHLRQCSQPLSPGIGPTLDITSIGSTVNHFPKISPQEEHLDLLVSFRLKIDAHACGVLFQHDNTGKGYTLRFEPSTSGLFSMSLLVDFPSLDDFWADQYNIHLPRPVDGPEITRHEELDVSDGVILLLRGQVIETFCGGRSITWRLPLPDSSNKPTGETRRLGWFVEDGSTSLSNLSVLAVKS
ncbi:unnamed protein product [Clonostachys chloroleuca]|uniref:beta-fructofuranosidase n=1 Tax=Clonostachys chloroleuca TaxID=1926264 RepID=A0AA35MGL4_9HYPO|nr:unnamed protein product [Clonostachys chloroleuca]